MNVLIIGGSGFIGPHVAPAPPSQFCSGALISVAIDVVSGDRNDVGAIRHITSSRRIDIVIDMLAYAEDTTVPLLDALEGTIKRYVLISLCDVYSNYEGLLRIDRPPIIEATEEDGPSGGGAFLIGATLRARPPTLRRGSTLMTGFRSRRRRGAGPVWLGASYACLWCSDQVTDNGGLAG